MNPFLEIRGLGHCIALMSVRVVSLASEIGMGHYSDSTLCAASEAAAVGSGSLIKPDSIGFLRQEKQITALVCLDWSALSGSALRQKSHTHISLSLTEISIYAPSVSVGWGFPPALESMASIPVNPSTEESSWKLGFSCSVCLKASALRLLASMSRRSGAGCAGRCAGFGNFMRATTLWFLRMRRSFRRMQRSRRKSLRFPNRERHFRRS